MKIIRLNIGLTLLALGLGACHNSSSPSMLDRIDSLTYTCPAMALKKLDSTEASSGTLSKDDKMMCSMLRVKAKFKAYQPIGKDSQIVQVAEYYDQNGTAHQRMNVHYLLGILYAAGRRPSRAGQLSKSDRVCRYYKRASFIDAHTWYDARPL